MQIHVSGKEVGKGTFNVTECIECHFFSFYFSFFNGHLFLLPSPSASGGSYHVVRAEAAEDADGADHLPVQVCLPGSHPVPQELPPHLSQAS